MSKIPYRVDGMVVFWIDQANGRVCQQNTALDHRIPEPGAQIVHGMLQCLLFAALLLIQKNGDLFRLCIRNQITPAHAQAANGSLPIVMTTKERHCGICNFTGQVTGTG